MVLTKAGGLEQNKIVEEGQIHSLDVFTLWMSVSRMSMLPALRLQSSWFSHHTGTASPIPLLCLQPANVWSWDFLTHITT